MKGKQTCYSKHLPGFQSFPLWNFPKTRFPKACLQNVAPKSITLYCSLAFNFYRTIVHRFLLIILTGVVSAMLADGGKCETRLTGVPFPDDPEDSSIYKFPRCVDVARCSHCCSNDLFECAPTLTTDRYFNASHIFTNTSCVLNACTTVLLL